jgi:thiosulfate/3-mercaptopyruvate sulfurtransferase
MLGPMSDDPGPLVSAAWLRDHLGDRDLRLVHVSTEPEHYPLGHLPGAVFSDLHQELAHRGVDPAVPGVEMEYLIPGREDVERVLARWGVGPDDRVVFYDDVGLNRHAIRGLWLLRLYGWPPDRVHVLDGGLEGWRRAGEPVTTEPVRPRTAEPVHLAGGEPSLLAVREQVEAWSRESVDGGPIRILDVRTAAEYTGDDLRTRRGGHIPGAVNLDWEAFLTEDGRLRSPAEIRQLADAAAGGDASTVRAVHCQGGIRAAAAWFVLHELAGLEVANYARAWEEWGNREDTPIAS